MWWLLIVCNILFYRSQPFAESCTVKWRKLENLICQVNNAHLFTEHLKECILSPGRIKVFEKLQKLVEKEPSLSDSDVDSLKLELEWHYQNMKIIFNNIQIIQMNQCQIERNSERIQKLELRKKYPVYRLWYAAKKVLQIKKTSHEI